MAHVIRYVDPDAPGPTHDGTSWNNAYTSLDDWNDNEATDLVSDDDYHTVYCRSSSGTADTKSVNVQGWNTDASHDINIIGFDFPTDGIWDNTAYRIYTNGRCIRVGEDFVNLINLQLWSWETVASYVIAIEPSSDITNTSAVTNIDSCILRCTGTEGGNCNSGIMDYSKGTVNVYNTLFLDWEPSAGAGRSHSEAVYVNTTNAKLNMYNCTCYNCAIGITNDHTGCTVNAINSIFSGGGVVWGYESGDVNVDYCCSDAGTGTNSQTPSGGDWDNEFTDKDNKDFSLLATGNCAENGTNNPGSGLYLDDIIGTGRS